MKLASGAEILHTAYYCFRKVPIMMSAPVQAASQSTSDRGGSDGSGSWGSEVRAPPQLGSREVPLPGLGCWPPNCPSHGGKSGELPGAPFSRALTPFTGSAPWLKRLPKPRPPRARASGGGSRCANLGAGAPAFSRVGRIATFIPFRRVDLH